MRTLQLLEVIDRCGLRCYPRVICRVVTSVFTKYNFFLGLICTARYVSSFLKISSGGTKFEIFREQVGYLRFVLLRGARMFDLLLKVMLLLITCVISVFVWLYQR